MDTQVMACDYGLNQTALRMSGILAADSVVRLFINDVTLDNDTPYSAFTQSAAISPSSIVLAGKSRGVTRRSKGSFQAEFGPFHFSNPAGPSVTVYGWIITDVAGNMFFSYKFSSPIVLPAMSGYGFSVTIPVKGLNVACP